MKKITSILMAALAIAATGCKESVIEEKEDILVESVVLDNTISNGYTLVEGSTLNIADKVSVTPADAVDLDRIYASSDEETATISDEGLITAIKEGTATITVTVGSRGKKAEFVLTVSKNVIAVEDISLSDGIKNGIELTAGQSLDISSYVTVLPEDATNKAVSYSSSDENIATVSADGTIEAKAEGTVTITITAEGGKQASFTLTVKPVPAEETTITSLSFSEQEIEYELASAEGIDLKSMLAVEPADYTESIVFESSDAEVASVDQNGMMTLHKLSRGVTITAKSAANPEVSASLTVKAYRIGAVRHNRHINANEEPDENLAWNTIMYNNTFISMTARNNSPTAMLDEDIAYKDPETTKITDGDMTVFCFTRPGKSSGGVDLRFNEITDTEERQTTINNYEIYFIIDMKETHIVDFLDLKHLSYGAANNSDMGTRICGFTEISAGNSLNAEGNDLSDAKVVANNVNFRDKASDKEAWTIGETIFTDTPVECRYMKFMLRGTEHYDGNGSNSGNTAQIKEFYLGYSKAKIYSE